MVAQFIHSAQYTCPRRVAPKSTHLTMTPDRDVSGIDELVMMRAAGKGDLYVHQDANFNVIGVTDLGGSLVERYVLEPYGELTVHQLSSYGDRDGDGDVDATDKGTPGTTCTGTVSGSCRILDLDFDGDYDTTDATLFDNLDAGNAVHPGRRFSALGQPFGHQRLWLDAEAGQYQSRVRRYDPTKRRFLEREMSEGTGIRFAREDEATNVYNSPDTIELFEEPPGDQAHNALDDDEGPDVAPVDTCTVYSQLRGFTPTRFTTYHLCKMAALRALNTPRNLDSPPDKRTWCYRCKRVRVKVRGVWVDRWDLIPFGCRGSCNTTLKPFCRPAYAVTELPCHCRCEGIPI
jgi:hypothetical protein